MKIKKNYWVGALIAVFLLYTAIVFMLPIDKVLNFWLSYFLAAICFLCPALVNRSERKGYFENILSTITVVFLAIQVLISIIFMFLSKISIAFILFTYICVGLVECTFIFGMKGYQKYQSDREENKKSKRNFSETVYKKLQELEMQSDNAEISKKLIELQEIVKFGKKESNETVWYIEKEIIQKIDTLYVINSNVEDVLKILKELEVLLKRRNVIL